MIYSRRYSFFTGRLRVERGKKREAKRKKERNNGRRRGRQRQDDKRNWEGEKREITEPMREFF